MKTFQEFIIESYKPFIARNGMTLYHSSREKFKQFINRPTWFTPTLKEANAYAENLKEDVEFTLGDVSSYLYICTLKTDKILNEKQVKEFTEKIFPKEDILYSMFDENIGEFETNKVKELINSIKKANFNGVIHRDYSAIDNQIDSYTIVVFEPVKYVKINKIETT